MLRMLFRNKYAEFYNMCVCFTSGCFLTNVISKRNFVKIARILQHTKLRRLRQFNVTCIRLVV